MYVPTCHNASGWRVKGVTPIQGLLDCNFSQKKKTFALQHQGRRVGKLVWGLKGPGSASSQSHPTASRYDISLVPSCPFDGKYSFTMPLLPEIPVDWPADSDLRFESNPYGLRSTPCTCRCHFRRARSPETGVEWGPVRKCSAPSDSRCDPRLEKEQNQLGCVLGNLLHISHSSRRLKPIAQVNQPSHTQHSQLNQCCKPNQLSIWTLSNQQ